MPPSWATPIRAVIFDNDGTLADTEWAYSWVHEQITGHPLDWEMKPRLMGKPALETCQLLVEYYHLDTTPEALVETRTNLIATCWKDIKLLPGAVEIVAGLEARHSPMAIATSSRRQVFDQKCQSYRDFYAKFQHAITGTDVTNGKPHPEIFLKALAKWPDLRPEEVIVFEDSPLGIEAANAAGMASVFVPDSNMDVDAALAVKGAKPTVIIPSLLEFDFEQFLWAGAQ
jgi:pseudouridine-5'-monophosphatase